MFFILRSKNKQPLKQGLIMKEKIRNLIAKSKLKQALDLLPNDNEFVLLKSRYNANEKNKRLGIVGNDEYNRTRNQITNALLEMLEDVDWPEETSKETKPPTVPPDSTISTTSSGDSNNREPIKVFISYAHADMTYKIKLETALSVYERMDKIKIWNDQDIPAGAKWEEEIMQHLNNDDVIILLLSSDFFASDYIWDKELPVVLKRYEQESVKVVPILLRPCAWEDTPYAKIQAIPTNPDTGKLTPVSLWSDKDLAWSVVVKKLRDLINSF